MNRLSRPAVSGLVLAAAFVLMLWLAADVLLIVFASILVGTLLHGGAKWLTEHLRVPFPLSLAVFTVAIVGGILLLGVVAAPVLSQQAGQLWQQVPKALNTVKGMVEAQSWGPALLGQVSFDGLVNPSAGGAIAGRATSALASTFGALGTFAVICVLGVFLAADPGTYRCGVVLLVAPSGRERAEALLNQLGATLRSWLVAQLLAMAVIGLLTMLGLWALGIPLAVVLGVIAALFTFIPNLGPVLAAAPAVLLGLAASPIQGAYVAALYVGVQVIEGNVTTPMIQRYTIALPPALIIAAQLFMAGSFGLLGLALATPLLAVLITLVQLLYVHGFLGSEPRDRANDPVP